MTDWEKSSLLIYLAEEKLYEWLAFLLCDKDAPLTLNSIVFILELSKRLTMGSPKEIRIAVIVAAIYRKKSFSRLQIAQFLSEVISKIIDRNTLIFRRHFRDGFRFFGRPKLNQLWKRIKSWPGVRFRSPGAVLKQKELRGWTHLRKL